MNWVSKGICTLLCSITVGSYAQSPPPHETLFYNNGVVFIDSGAVVQIFGKTVSTGPQSLIHNDGSIYVHFDTKFPAAKRGFNLNNFTTVQGNGYYEIEPDWTNNTPNFIANASHVHLMSDIEQFITGSSVTNFNILQLSGSGVGIDKIKRMTINAFILDSLSLNNRELATDSFIMNVTNGEPTSISRDPTTANFGFVSSLQGKTQNGVLARRTSNSDIPYLFPVGSSLTTTVLYRPVDILPSSSNTNLFSVRMHNESPDVRGYDRFSLDDSLCSVNTKFYHMINHPNGFDTARVRFFYDPIQDGVFDNAAQWRNGKWNLLSDAQFVPGASYYVALPNQLIYSFDSLPFILADKIPVKAEIVGNPDICSNDLAMLRAVGKSNFYYWTVPGDIKALSAAGNDTLIMQVYETGGYVQMSASSSTGKCVEASDSFLITVHPGPMANFTASKTQAFTRQIINFRDSTIGSPIEWFWQFGDGNTGSTPIIKHKFENIGEYVVEMYVVDENGCLDSTYRIIEVVEGIRVPNIFTPNGDGSNDLFYIPNSGMKSYHFQVFNRWGNLIFETSAPEIAWDGHDNLGTPVSEGTYFYTLEAKGEENDYSQHGYLTLFR